MRKALLFTLLSLFCLAAHGQVATGEKVPVAYYQHKVSGGFKKMITVNGRPQRQGRMICLELIRGEWYVHGYAGEKEDTVKVTEKVARKVDKMIRKIRWSDLHPAPVEGLQRSDCDDAPTWSVYACTFSGDTYREIDTTCAEYTEPKKVAKRYRAAKRGIDKVNGYLMGLLSIF